jgi:adenylate cyclase
VDDGDANRDLLARQLRKEGHLVSVASNGAEALERVEAERFDLVLLDIMMPVMDGFEVLDRLKRDTVLREIPVIVISAADDMENIVRCIARGAEDFLPKPCHNEILRARIRVSLDKRKLRVAERESRKQLQAEMRRTETILRSILPHDVVEELKATNAVQPRRYEHVAVMFLDLVNFTQYCDHQPPDRVVGDLERMVDKLEEIAARHRIEKIKTIGDNFMATGGLRLPLENPVLSCVRCGVEMIEAVKAAPPHWNARVGIHVGPVVAGVIGKSKYAFDLWGDTVNTASRVESNGLAGTVNVSGQAWDQIAEHCRGESRGLVRVKGKEALEIIAFKEFLV